MPLNLNFVFHTLDRVKMYNHEYMNPDASPGALQRKVQFDLRLYFARRGLENMESMKKDHFKLDFDEKTELWRVVKAKDELTKNHKEIGSIISGIMPQNKDDRLCPVSSYVKYTSHLNPENEFLWQTELKKVDMEKDAIWYGKNKIGKNPLAKFMSVVSEKCGLSKIYTNHCIRVTGASILTRLKFSASEIMAVTGHKSVQSLAVYQKTDDKRKSEMGNVLGQAMQRRDEEIVRPIQDRQPLRALPPPQQNLPIEYRNQQIFNQQQEIGPPPPPQLPVQNVVQERENVTDAIVPFNHDNDEDDQAVPNFDLNQIINDVMNDPQQAQAPIISATNNNYMNNVPRSLFSNCHIGNITFNIQKK